MEQDRLSLHMWKEKPGRPDIPWKYEIILRKAEYYSNKKDRTLTDRILRRYYVGLHRGLSVRYMMQIPLNVCGPGLSIAHMGMVQIGAHTVIGKNLRILPGVLIGGSRSTPGEYPVLGDNIYFGAGAKILGGVRIADDVAIGANAVVTRDITEAGTTYAGIPARRISDHDSHAYIDERVLNG